MMINNFLPVWAIMGAAVKSISDRIEGAAGAHAGVANDAGAAEVAAELAGFGNMLPVKRVGRIAILDVEGPMIRSAGPIALAWGFESYERIIGAARNLQADSKVREVMLRVNSPGGSVDGLDEAVSALGQLAGSKPLIGQVRSVAASAAYELLTQAVEIRAPRADIVGSLGSIAMLYDFSRMLENEGIALKIASSEPKGREFKRFGAPGAPVTDEQMAELQRIVDYYAGLFRERLIAGRGMDRTQVDSIFDGRIWPAEQAVGQGLGLVDLLATEEETLAEMQARAAEDAGRESRARNLRAQLLQPGG